MRTLALALLLSSACTEAVPGWDTRFAGSPPIGTKATDIAAALECVAQRSTTPRARWLLNKQVITFTSTVYDGLMGVDLPGKWEMPYAVKVATVDPRTGLPSAALQRTAIYHELFRVSHYADSGAVLPSKVHATTFRDWIDDCKARADNGIPWVDPREGGGR